jgi:hypothetical protein
MNMKIDTDKLLAGAKESAKYIPAILIVTVVAIFGLLTYLALVPGLDKDLIAKGEARKKSLDIRFDTKLLKDLGTTKPSVQLGTAGGRDPFSRF